MKVKIEIEFNWDHGWGGRGSESMTISTEFLLEQISKLTTNTK